MTLQQTVVVLGASPKPDRYSNQAVRQLLAYGHHVLPVHPVCETIHGQMCYRQLADIKEAVDTLTVYVGENKSTLLLDDIIQLNPKRIIINPGAENTMMEQRAQRHEIEVIRSCTLVMLQMGEFA